MSGGLSLYGESRVIVSYMCMFSSIPVTRANGKTPYLFVVWCGNIVCRAEMQSRRACSEPAVGGERMHAQGKVNNGRRRALTRRSAPLASDGLTDKPKPRGLHVDNACIVPTRQHLTQPLGVQRYQPMRPEVV